MKITITSIELINPFKYFLLSRKALGIVLQLRNTDCVKMKKRGFWTTHYTMTLWNNEDDLKKFARSGAHLEAMKMSGQIAKEIKSLTIDADEFPSWAAAKSMLAEIEPIRY